MSTASSSDSSHSTTGDDSSSTPDVEEELPSTTELEYAFSDISHVITCLFRFSVALQQPAPRDRIRKYAAIDVSYYEFDVQHALDKLSHAPRYLAERMGKANTRRRQVLRYHMNHQTTATTFKIDNDAMEYVDAESETGQSQTSNTTSIASENERRPEVPPPPSGAVLDGTTPFQCPYCYTVITMKSAHHWTYVYSRPADTRPAKFIG